MKAKKFVTVILAAALLGVVAFAILAGRAFLRHERRQTADIEQLQIESWNRNTENKSEIKEYRKLQQQTEDKIDLFFQKLRLNAYQKLACGVDINLLIVGDSIGALPWTVDLSEWIKENYQVNCRMKNISLGGNDSYAGIVSEILLEDGTDYDLIVVCYGQNDSEEFFAIDYEALIRKTIADNPGCCIISVLESSQRQYTAKMRDIFRMAEYYRIEIADTIKAFEDSGYAYERLTDDGVHPNELGQTIYLDTVSEIIACRVEEEYIRKISIIEDGIENLRLPEYESYSYELKPVQNIMSKSAEELERYRFFPVSEFKRKSESTWEIELQNVSGKIGICWCRIHGENYLELLYNGMSLFSHKDYFKNEYTLFYIERIINDRNCYSGTIELKFGSKDSADRFEGLIFTDYSKA